MKRKLKADNFCHCIKKVKKSLRNQNSVKKNIEEYEQPAIAICVKSMLQSKGRTLKKFHCKKPPMLKTQIIK
jgi:hypothetical protein